MQAIKIGGILVVLALAAPAGCSTAEDLTVGGPLAYPNINTQAVSRPEGLMSPQQSQAELEALKRQAAQKQAATEREIEGRK